jgi:putative FmdB family regulatory protein
MPIYEYQCSDCGNQFEEMVRFSEASINPSCPACQSEKTKKRISFFASLGSSLGETGVSANGSCGSNGGFT